MEFDNVTVVLLVRAENAMTPELQDAHLAFLADLHDAGKLFAAGPIRDDASDIRGISLMSVGPQEALALKSADPAVRAGVFRLVVLPWTTPSGAIHFTHTDLPRSIADVLGA